MNVASKVPRHIASISISVKFVPILLPSFACFHGPCGIFVILHLIDIAWLPGCLVLRGFPSIRHPWQMPSSSNSRISFLSRLPFLPSFPFSSSFAYLPSWRILAALQFLPGRRRGRSTSLLCAMRKANSLVSFLLPPAQQIKQSVMQGSKKEREEYTNSTGLSRLSLSHETH